MQLIRHAHGNTICKNNIIRKGLLYSTPSTCFACFLRRITLVEYIYFRFFCFTPLVQSRTREATNGPCPNAVVLCGTVAVQRSPLSLLVRVVREHVAGHQHVLRQHGQLLPGELFTSSTRNTRGRKEGSIISTFAVLHDAYSTLLQGVATAVPSSNLKT